MIRVITSDGDTQYAAFDPSIHSDASGVARQGNVSAPQAVRFTELGVCGHSRRHVLGVGAHGSSVSTTLRNCAFIRVRYPRTFGPFPDALEDAARVKNIANAWKKSQRDRRR